jgi:hypothetical protein
VHALLSILAASHKAPTEGTSANITSNKAAHRLNNGAQPRLLLNFVERTIQSGVVSDEQAQI